MLVYKRMSVFVLFEELKCSSEDFFFNISCGLYLIMSLSSTWTTYLELQVGLGFMLRHCLKKQNTTKQNLNYFSVEYKNPIESLKLSKLFCIFLNFSLSSSVSPKIYHFLL
jgi:hypothetical protein